MCFKNTYIKYAAVITNIIDLGTTHIINNVNRHGGTGGALGHMPHLILEAYLKIFWGYLHF